MRVLSDNVLVERDAVEETVGEAGVIVAPDQAREAPWLGTVIAVGPGRVSALGSVTEIIPMQVKVGDRVCFLPYTGTPVPGDERKVVVSEDAILCVLDDE